MVLYYVQTNGGLQSIVSGVVQPDAVMAVTARTIQRTTLYLRRDITTPSVKETPTPEEPNATRQLRGKPGNREIRDGFLNVRLHGTA